MSFWLWVSFAIVFVLAVTLSIASLRMDDDQIDEDTWRKF